MRVIFLFYESKCCVLSCCFESFSNILQFPCCFIEGCYLPTHLSHRSQIYLQMSGIKCCSSFSFMKSVIWGFWCIPTFSSTRSMFKRFNHKPTSGVRTPSYFKHFIFHFISFSLNHHLRVARVAGANPTSHEAGVEARDWCGHQSITGPTRNSTFALTHTSHTHTTIE